MTMTRQGTYQNLNVSSGHPPPISLVDYGDWVYQLTFDNSLFNSVTNTDGHPRLFRSRRYATP